MPDLHSLCWPASNHWSYSNCQSYNTRFWHPCQTCGVCHQKNTVVNHLQTRFWMQDKWSWLILTPVLWPCNPPCCPHSICVFSSFPINAPLSVLIYGSHTIQSRVELLHASRAVVLGLLFFWPPVVSNLVDKMSEVLNGRCLIMTPTATDVCVCENMILASPLKNFFIFFWPLKVQRYVKTMQCQRLQRRTEHMVSWGVYVLPCIEGYHFIMHARPLEKVYQPDLCCTLHL